MEARKPEEYTNSCSPIFAAHALCAKEDIGLEDSDDIKIKYGMR